MIRTLAISLAATAALAVSAQQGRLLRFPTTNGTDIVFSYAGDLYTVPANGGEARRLTSHVGYEMFPRFSPDGKTIAFTGQYDGNTEVFTIPAQGGEPVRLTYSPTNSRDDIGDRMGPNNIVVTWSPDGSKVLYRNRIGDGFEGALWTVSPTGGMPEKLPLPEGGFASYSPDGKKLAYNRVMREFRNWKYYRGGMADDIWIYDPAANKVTNITDNPAQDIIPMWIGDEIYFISDRDMRMNIFCYNTKTGKTEKVTSFADYDVKFPSTDGKSIVFENGGYIYRLDPATKKATQVPVTLNGENLYARPERMDVSSYVTAADISPDGKRMLLTARGEVFDVPATKGVTRNLSRTPGANERGAAWSPDGKTIAYISDVTGETEIWTVPAGGGTPKQLTKGSDTYIRSLSWSPDSKRIIYTDRKNRMVSVDPATGAKKTLAKDDYSEFRGISYSPDSRWIAYTRPAANDMSVVYLMDLTTGKEIPVTEKWYDSSSPMFSADGKYLFFNSARDFNPTYGSLEWNHVYNNLYNTYMVMLDEATPSPLLPDDSETYAAPEPEKKDEKAPVSVTVTPAGISQRIVKLPLSPAYRPLFYSDGNKLYYSGQGGIKSFDLKKQKEETVTEGHLMALTADGKKAIIAKGGKYYAVSFPGKPDEAADLSNMTALVDYPQEWAQIFDETWRAFRDGFYLENMHGVDWNAMKTKYGQLLPYVKTRLDLNYVIGAMISELACGHAYINPGEVPRPERIAMGLLGADISRAKNGTYRIDAILEGAPYSAQLRSPLAQHGLGVKAGDIITAIDGTPTTSVDNIYKLLIGKAGVPTELTIASANGKESRKIVVNPVDNEYPLRHYAWVQRNIHLVDSLSGGKVGYIYIPDMGPDGLNEFARYYYPQLDKEALIIDDRANGGGNVSPMIIERLLRKPYRMTMSRHSKRTGTIPDATHVGPKVLLINKYSASDGDLFPWSFKANNLGTVIGTRTWGGIIGISGSLPFMDGTDVRVPFFTNYDAKTGQWIVENHGVDPDILIDNDPIKENAGLDQQLEEAIRVAMQQLKDRKPTPPVPAPRTFKDLSL